MKLHIILTIGLLNTFAVSEELRGAAPNLEQGFELPDSCVASGYPKFIDLVNPENQSAFEAVRDGLKRIRIRGGLTDGDWTLLSLLLQDDIPNIRFLLASRFVPAEAQERSKFFGDERFKILLPAFQRIILNQITWSSPKCESVSVEIISRAALLESISYCGEPNLVDTALKVQAEIEGTHNLSDIDRKYATKLIVIALRNLGYDMSDSTAK